MATTTQSDFVRGAQPDGTKVLIFGIENEDNSGTRVFSETDLENRTTTAVLASTGTTPDVDKGSDGSQIFGFVENLSEDDATVDVLVLGITDEIAYAAATEDPDVGDRVLSKGDGKVKQGPAATDLDLTAGQPELGQGKVFYKDTTNSYVRLVFPS